MAKVFVSYRRQDSAYFAATLKERIERRLGDDSVFFDIDNIPVGADFRKHIEAAVSQCHAMLVLIGDKWLAPVKEAGKSRLFDPRDNVRMEIEAALGRGIHIVPVLIENAEMPGPDDLPETIQAFTFRNAAEVRAGRDFHGHMARLVDALGRLLEPEPVTARTSSPPAARKTRSTATPVMKAKIAAKKDSTAAKKEKTAATKKTAKTEKGAANKVLRCLTLTSLRRAFKDSSGTYVGSSIPANKLHNAVTSYGLSIDSNDVLVLHDHTVFGGARNGFLLTKTSIHWRNLAEGPGFLDFCDLKRVKKGPSSVEVNGRVIIMSDEVAKGLSRLLKEIMPRRS